MARNPNRMQEAVTKLMGNFQGHASVVVSYKQDTTSIHGIAATPDRTPFEIMEGNVVVPYESHDFIIAVADLQGFKPTSGDTITDAAGRKFIVSMPGKMNVYESFQGIAYKIRTKAVS